MIGSYKLEKNENIDEYFKAIGVPYVARKLIAASSPTMEISQNNDDWTIKTISLIRTVTIVFKLNEEYEEQMPGGLLKTIMNLNGDKLESASVAEDGTKICRSYDFNDTHCIIVSIIM